MKFIVLIIMLLASATVPAADRHESHDRIRMLAERHAVALGRSQAPANADVRAESSRLDPRLRLARCQVEPETFSPPGQRPGANVNVGLRCPTLPAWSLYVPVRLEVTADVVVLGAPASRGEPLTAIQLRLERRDVARLAGDWITELEQAEGMMLRRVVQPGSVITQTMLERPSIVRRGDRVRIQSSGGAFAVSSEGEALSDAAAGDRVRVRNLHSRSVVEGVVDEHGRVRTGS